MEKKINLKGILDKFDKYNCISEAQLSDIIPAMKEACRQVLELAAENATIEEVFGVSDTYIPEKYHYCESEVIGVSVKSILNTIKQIE